VRLRAIFLIFPVTAGLAISGCDSRDLEREKQSAREASERQVRLETSKAEKRDKDEARQAELAQQHAEKIQFDAQIAQEHTLKMRWLDDVRQNCESYRKAINDIKRSEIYRRNEALLDSIQLDQVRMKLTTLYTPKGGAWVRLRFEDYLSNLALVQDKIAIDTSVYKSASSMATGQCVQVTGKLSGSTSILEESRVCSLDYRIELGTLEWCS
jgi:hypothetical protein